MQLDGLTIALRTRSPWEATDLGVALARRHAARIYAAWFAVTAPVFVLLNAGGWFLQPWMAAIAFWWLKPAFDRIPLYVVSRAVFGPAPSLRETLAAQRTWGWRGLAPWLLWRRFHPGRAMLLPVDLLEGGTGVQRRERVHVLTRAHASPNVMLTLIGVNLELVLGTAVVMLALMFVPVEFLSDSAKTVWQTLVAEPPRWALVVVNAIGWFAMSVVEPFYVCAGFGLYLNRRIQLEAWDIELAFRRLGARLTTPLGAAALLLLAVLAHPLPLAAAPGAAATEQGSQRTTDETLDDTGAEHAPADKHTQISTTLPELFGDDYTDDGKTFAEDVKKVYETADLAPTRREFVWRRRHPADEDAKADADVSPVWRAVAAAFAFVAQYGLWIALLILLAIVVFNLKRWLPWVSDRIAPPPLPQRIDERDVARAAPLPADLPAAVRALMAQGRVRAALALLYRGGVERLTERLGVALPPGSTEAECLRQSRRLADVRYAALFARIVRSWQSAAYAQRVPPSAEIEDLLEEWVAPVETPP
ncbi:MAG TPA: DUF4129 domain-containing protein [Rudaea sp.]|nr:DUF4129 domain-containing protein [Rudaea sp.]